MAIASFTDQVTVSNRQGALADTVDLLDGDLGVLLSVVQEFPTLLSLKHGHLDHGVSKDGPTHPIKGQLITRPTRLLYLLWYNLGVQETPIHGAKLEVSDNFLEFEEILKGKYNVWATLECKTGYCKD